MMSGMKEIARRQIQHTLAEGRPELKALYVLLRPAQRRTTAGVTDEYTASWQQHSENLDRAATLADWLSIAGVDDRLAYYNIDGRPRRTVFNPAGFYRSALLAAIRKHFPDARSVTEYGCGLGRNLLELKRQMPELAVYGYELCKPGVEIARRAATRFGVDASYAQLDYVRGPESDYVFPATDIAFTMFSLEQLPDTNAIGMRNIHAHTRLGSIHIEPVVENYPRSVHGALGRIVHRKFDYLRDFEENVRSLGLECKERSLLARAHNPLMFPSLYVLTKKV